MKRWFDRLMKHPRVKRILAVLDDLGHKQIGLLAAGIAYFSILAFFPLVVATVALGSLVLQADTITQTTNFFSHALPSDLAGLLTTQLHNAEGHRADSVIAIVVALVLSVLSVAGATGSLMSALNVMYGYRERRSFVRQRLVSLGLTLAMIVAMVVTAALLVASSGFLRHIGASTGVVHVLEYGRWPVLVIGMMAGLMVLYRVGPSHQVRPSRRQVMRGVIGATVIWIVVSALFFWYLGSLAHLTRSYSLFAGMIGMMLWLNLTAYIVLLGAEINVRHLHHKKA